MQSSPSSPPCCIHEGKKARKRWTEEEDEILLKYINDHGQGHWRTVAENSGLSRCCKSIRFRYMDHFRPGAKRGNITQDEKDLIIQLHRVHGNRWSEIAKRFPGRTDNEIKNYWYTHLREEDDYYKYMNEDLEQIIDVDQRPRINNIPLINEEEAVIYPETSATYNWEN